MFGPLGLSLAPYVQSSRTLSKWITPIANWYANAAGYRKYGFKYDDLRTYALRLSPRGFVWAHILCYIVVEENDEVQRVRCTNI